MEEKETKSSKIWEGVKAIGIALGLYLFFSYIEYSGDSVRIPWWAYLLYKLGGKYIITGLIALYGISEIWEGLSKSGGENQSESKEK
ncbi:MAG: hypothetical protein LCH37_12135 [Bacteroidetes bacterium]|nr:hypothetical protein [Bacteroidota bacterium]